MYALLSVLLFLSALSAGTPLPLRTTIGTDPTHFLLYMLSAVIKFEVFLSSF